MTNHRPLTNCSLVKKKKSYRFSRLSARLLKVNVHNFRCFRNSLRIADVVSVERFIEDQENVNTKKNVALLQELLTLKNESRKGGQIKYPMMLCAKISQVLFFSHAKKCSNGDFSIMEYTGIKILKG